MCIACVGGVAGSQAHTSARATPSLAFNPTTPAPPFLPLSSHPSAHLLPHRHQVDKLAEGAHPDFRLFLSAEPPPALERPLPISLLQARAALGWGGGDRGRVGCSALGAAGGGGRGARKHGVFCAPPPTPPPPELRQAYQRAARGAARQPDPRVRPGARGEAAAHACVLGPPPPSALLQGGGEPPSHWTDALLPSLPSPPPPHPHTSPHHRSSLRRCWRGAPSRQR